MSKIINLAFSDFKRRWNKPALIILYIITPIIITFIMWIAFGGGSGSSGVSPLKIAVVNNDKGGVISDFLVNGLNNERVKDKIKTFVVSEEESFKLINSRKISGIIIIPKGFTKNILNRQKTEIKLIKNPTEIIYPMIAETGLNIVKDGTNYLLTIFKDEIEIIKNSVENKEKINSTVLVSLYDKIRDKIKKLVPLFEEQKIEIQDVTEEKKGGSLAIYFFAGMSFFFLFFISNAVLNDMVKERNKFIIKRLFLSELKKSEYYFSRLISVVIFLFTIEIFLAITGGLLFGIKVPSLFWLLSSLLISAIVLSLCSAIIMALSKNERQSHNLGMIFVFFFAILGGSLIPVSSLPPSVRGFSVFSPLYYITESTIALSTQRLDRFFHMMTIASLIAVGLFIISYLLNIKALKRVIK